MIDATHPDATLRMHWLRAARWYLCALVPLNLFWELIQLPLYQIWQTAPPPTLIFAVVHCTAGDVLIGVTSLFAALLIGGADDWPRARFGWVAGLTILGGLLFTIYSEWHNTIVVRSWAYAAAMPTLAGIGLTPLAQWLVIPAVLFWRLHTRRSS